MKTHQRLLGVALFSLVIQLSLLHASAPAVRPVVAYAKVTGQMQGNFWGNATAPDFERQIALVNVEFDESGGGKGKLIIEKYPDASSNKFQNALLKNESIIERFYTDDKI